MRKGSRLSDGFCPFGEFCFQPLDSYAAHRSITPSIASIVTLIQTLSAGNVGDSLMLNSPWETTDGMPLLPSLKYYMKPSNHSGH